MAGDERNFPSRDARYSSPRFSMTHVGSHPRRRLLSGGGSSNGTRSNTWGDAVTSTAPAFSLSPLVTPAYNPLQGFQATVTPPKPRQNQQMPRQRSVTSTSCDESTSDELNEESRPKSASKRPKTRKRSVKQEAGANEEQSRKRKERKPTHTLRKEQKQELLEQVEHMQTQLDNLKSQAIISNALHVKKRTHAPVMNAILRDAVQSRQSVLADVQGLVSGYVQQQHEISPINTCIKLGLDRAQRHRELVAMKEAKLCATHAFLLRRSRGLVPGKLYCEEERFETSGGDYCALRFAVSHFRGASSVRSVFDAALFHVANVEISMSEVLGNITIREDDDSGDDNVSHLRLVSSTGTAPQAPPLETNSVQFNEFREASATGGPNGSATSEFGVILGDFVDEDNLYPYRPRERLRKDVTASLLVTRLSKEEQTRYFRRSNATSGGCGSRAGETDDQLIVKVTLWSLIKLHHSDLEVPYDCLEETRHEIGRWGEEMVHAIRRSLALKQTQP